MYCYSLKHGKEYAKQAVKEDASGNYAKAFQFYMNALEYLRSHLKYENNPEIEKKIRQKSMGYLRRAEEIRAVLDSRRSEQPKPNLKGRKEKDKDKEDPEQVKLRVGLDSVIIREKPNVKWSDVAGLESAKKALKKAVILPVRFLQFFTEKRKPWRALFQLYMNALEFLHTHLKYEKYPKIEKTIRQKSMGYLSEVEEIRAILDSRGSRPSSYSSPLVTEQSKPNLKGRKERDKYKEDPEQAKLRGGLDFVIIREKPNVEWSNVAGLESAKKALKEAVILPVRFPQFFTGKRKPWRAFLLYGPPGTGKSYLAKAVATEADSTFLSVSSSDLVSKWMGESEKLVSNLFQMARDNAPSIIFIDEIDSLCGQRGEGNESEASRRLKTELLVQIQGVGNDNEKVLVLAATNMPSALDQAIRRRFNKRIYIPLPDLKARGHMFKVHLGDTPHNLTERDFEDLGQRTEGFSGSDISVCVKDALFEPVRKTQDARYFRKSFKGVWAPCEPTNRGAVKITLEELYSQGQGSKILPPPITKSDFDKVLMRQKPTVSKADLDAHDRFTKEFGEEGR